MDDPPHNNAPIEEGRSYYVNVLKPLPPEIEASVGRVLDPIADDLTPIVRRTRPVMSIVGLTEPKGGLCEIGDDGSTSIDDAMEAAGPAGRVAFFTGPTRKAFLDGRDKARKARACSPR